MTRRGFTLIELLVALLVAGIAVSIAAAVFAAATDAVDDLEASSRRWSREANGRRWLAQLLTSVEVRNNSESRFAGFPDSLRLRTRYWVPEGWLETGVVSIAFDGRRLRGRMPDGSALLLADSLGGASFDYLIRYGAESRWQRRWESATTAPLAVRLRIERMNSSGDTILFYVGERG